VAITYKVLESRLLLNEEGDEFTVQTYVEVNDDGDISSYWIAGTVSAEDAPTYDFVSEHFNSQTGGTPADA